MTSLAGLFVVAKLSYQLIQHIKHAPIHYQQTVTTLESLSCLLNEIISITKQFHELDPAQLKIAASGSLELPPIERVVGKDWVIDLDSPIGNDIHDHISQCIIRLTEFKKATTKWEKMAPDAGEGGLVVSVRRAIVTRLAFSKRKMQVFERAIQKHIDALRVHLFLAAARSQVRVEERITQIEARLDRDGPRMFEKVEALRQITLGIAPNLPSDNIRIFEPYGKLTNLHISLCSSVADILSTLSIALKGTEFPNLSTGSPVKKLSCICGTCEPHPEEDDSEAVQLVDSSALNRCCYLFVKLHFRKFSFQVCYDDHDDKAFFCCHAYETYQQSEPRRSLFNPENSRALNCDTGCSFTNERSARREEPALFKLAEEQFQASIGPRPARSSPESIILSRWANKRVYYTRRFAQAEVQLRSVHNNHVLGHSSTRIFLLPESVPKFFVFDIPRPSYIHTTERTIDLYFPVEIYWTLVTSDEKQLSKLVYGDEDFLENSEKRLALLPAEEESAASTS